MPIKVAINGFGRIGRLVLRAWLGRVDTSLQIVAVNDLGDVSVLRHLLHYDSVHGRYEGATKWQGETLVTEKGAIRFVCEPDPQRLPWSEVGVDIVLECSGRFTTRKAAAAHLEAGAQKVLVSAPCADADMTLVYGVNHHALGKEHDVVSNASCTTNCLVPVVHVVDKLCGLDYGYMTTVHSYTGDQKVVDMVHKDMRRARAASLSMIPTTSGAARAVCLVLPHLEGRIDGCAVRVPTPNVSLADLTFVASKDVSKEALHDAMRRHAQGPLQGILALNDAPLVSSDFIGHPASSIFDETQTHVMGKRFVRVVAWYDNEWGFSNRMLDSAQCLARHLSRHG
ncbi:MAG: type I glyceraldehyde-3-phosphate dehydrogenase [Alphaproteobacteria bacterium GM7ARS4]|nr:type I glyceraldehyde-3-phosphate dehydrogenase [Alphaproteobacteria bacterium GM7ARS4]